MMLLGCLPVVAPTWLADAHADPPGRPWPITGVVVRGFQTGEHDWSPGHRGIDILGANEQTVHAPADGVVAWVGVIDGVPMMSIDHPDGTRTTYQPVEALLPRSAPVASGQAIAIVKPGHCPDQICLHFGVKRGDHYLDPLDWLGGRASGQVRLLPADAKLTATAPPGPADSAIVGVPPSGLPVDGPITSGFGYRISPISGANELHDGIDIGAGCGQPVVLTRPGQVIFTGVAGGYGLRVEVDHGMVNGVHLATNYNHLSQILVGPGQTVTPGQTIALVGTTGWSTGCHLHWGATADGLAVDPLGSG